MRMDQLLFFFENFFDQLLVVCTQFVDTFAVLSIKFVVMYRSCSQLGERQSVGSLSPSWHLFLASGGWSLGQSWCFSPWTHFNFSILGFDGCCWSLFHSRTMGILGSWWVLFKDSRIILEKWLLRTSSFRTFNRHSGWLTYSDRVASHWSFRRWLWHLLLYCVPISRGVNLLFFVVFRGVFWDANATLDFIARDSTPIDSIRGWVIRWCVWGGGGCFQLCWTSKSTSYPCTSTYCRGTSPNTWLAWGLILPL